MNMQQQQEKGVLTDLVVHAGDLEDVAAENIKKRERKVKKKLLKLIKEKNLRIIIYIIYMGDTFKGL